MKNMNYDTIGESNDVIDECLKVQKDFWDFYRSYNEIPKDKLFYKISFEVGKEKFIFCCVNTAWMSQKNEKPGSIFFPVKRYPLEDKIRLNWSFGVWHHPYNWFTTSTIENNKKEFEELTETLSNTHFFGHEHEQTHYKIENRNTDRKINLSSGDLFNEDNKPKTSGFQVLTIDCDNSEALHKIYRFDTSSGIYIPSERPIDLSKDSRKRFQVNEAYLKTLESIRIPLVIDDRKEIKLSELFVFPDLDSETRQVKMFDSYINSIRILDKDFGNCIIDGESQIGKSSLLAQLFLRFYDNGYSPIMLTGKALLKINLNKIVKRAFKIQYNDMQDYENFNQSEPSNLILLIDDFQDADFNTSITKRFFEEATFNFGKIIVVLDSTTGFLPSMKAEFNNFKNFKFYTIKPFGFKRRNDLVERYYNLKADFGRNHEEVRLTIIKTIFESIQSVLGDKLIPPYPVFVLSILQALEYKPMKNETSFGYCYQTLIHYP